VTPDQIESVSDLDVHFLARQQVYNSYINGICALILMVRIVVSFSVNPYIEWMFFVIKHSLSRILAFLIAITPFLIFLIFYLYYFAGFKVKEASSITRSIFTWYRLMMGIGNTSQYYALNPYMYLFWVFLIVAFVFFIILPISIAFLLESFDTITMKLGHVTDHASPKTKGKKKNKLLQWIQNWNLLAQVDKAQRAYNEEMAKREKRK
jgi:hypothetical protein